MFIAWMMISQFMLKRLKNSIVKQLEKQERTYWKKSVDEHDQVKNEIDFFSSRMFGFY